VGWLLDPTFLASAHFQAEKSRHLGWLYQQQKQQKLVDASFIVRDGSMPASTLVAVICGHSSFV